MVNPIVSKRLNDKLIFFHSGVHWQTACPNFIYMQLMACRWLSEIACLKWNHQCWRKCSRYKETTFICVRETIHWHYLELFAQGLWAIPVLYFWQLFYFWLNLTPDEAVLLLTMLIFFCHVSNRNIVYFFNFYKFDHTLGTFTRAAASKRTIFLLIKFSSV